MFLASLERLGAIVEQPLSAEARSALEAALRYFRESAPKHTADEEESLFPRLRQKEDPALQDAIRSLSPLEQEHRRAELLHSQVDRLGRAALGRGMLSAQDARDFRQAIAELLSIYKEHIRIEDEVLFPAAGRVLSPTEKLAIAGEMAARRK